MEQGGDFNAEKKEGQPEDAAFFFHHKENAFSLRVPRGLLLSALNAPVLSTFA